MHSTPHYPDFKPLDLEDRDQITSFLRRNPPITSELTFTNLFIWRHHYRFRWCVAADSLLILADSADGLPFALPPIGPGDLTSALLQLFSFIGGLTPTVQIHRFPEALIQPYVEPLSLTVKEDRANSDYIYRTESLATLKGRKYHGKRNQIKQFRKRYTYRYEPLSSEHIEACLDLEEDWCRLRNCVENQTLLGEEQAIHQALTHFHELHCQGAVILIESKVVAFSLGEELNPDTAVIHIEKANPEFTGSYGVINQEFCQNAWGHFIYVNREQDMGEEGLRRAKLSYYPHHLVNKVVLQATG